MLEWEECDACNFHVWNKYKAMQYNNQLQTQFSNAEQHPILN